MKTIQISEVLAEVNMVNSVFSVKYRKDDGTVGFKKNATLRRGNNELNDKKKMNRSGLLKLFIPKTGEEQDVTIDLIFEFNEMEVKRPPYLL